MRRWLLTLGLLLIAINGAVTQVWAQAWPTKPIKAIVPFSAGSAVDIIARTVLDQVSTQIGQPIVVENRVGAGGTLGVGSVAKADPDGYTLLVHSTTHVVTASTYSNPGYDTRKDFAAITALASLPNVLVVPANKYKTLKDLVAAAKAKPGEMNYRVRRRGQFVASQRRALSGGGRNQGATRSVQGRPGSAHRHHGRSGAVLFRSAAARARPLRRRKGRNSGRERHQALVRAAERSDHGGGWLSQFGIQFLGRDVRAGRDAEGGHRQAQCGNGQGAAIRPVVKQKLANVGGDPLPMTPAEFTAFTNKEIDVNAALVKAAGVKIN